LPKQKSNIAYIHFMIKRFSFFAIFLSSLFFNACSEGKLYQNNKEHVKLGQTFIGKFYKEVSKNNFDKAATYFSESVTKTDVIALLKQNLELHGKLKEVKFITATSSITDKNHHLNGEMTLTFEANYTRLSTTENLTLSVKDDVLLIEGYDYKVNIDKIGKN
jgi:hypothetical protein